MSEQPTASGEPNDIPSLWDFATDFYARPGIEEICLRLQDEHDFDVNLLLFCCWYGVHYGGIEETLLQTLYEYSCDWQHNAVQPLRQTRRWLKTAIATSPGNEQDLTRLRERVKAIELESERQQLVTLAAMARAVQPEPSAQGDEGRCAGNLGALRRLMQKEDDEGITDLVGNLLRALPA